MTKHIKFSAAAMLMLGTGGLLFVLLTARATNSRQYPSPVAAMAGTASVSTAPPPPRRVATEKTAVPAASPASVLDERRQFALGMIETGNDDREIGGAGEVSRYQIMPVIWHEFSDSQSYRSPTASQRVARRLWARLYARFKRQAHREPSDFDMYVLWNTRYGYYAGKGFNPARLAPVVRDRAQRFVNLVERADS